MIKRTLDIVCSALALLALSPVILGVAIAIAIKMGRPVIHKSSRAGKDGRPFVMYKFRTMTENVDGNGALLPDGDRLTGLGRFLRSTSLDELPEFWNVLAGDMSLVGPRPLLLEYLPLYSERQARRHEVRPGLTGLAQVNGRNSTDWGKRLELDVQYLESRSLFLDLKILVRTVALVCKRDGIKHPADATMPRFTGAEND